MQITNGEKCKQLASVELDRLKNLAGFQFNTSMFSSTPAALCSSAVVVTSERLIRYVVLLMASIYLGCHLRSFLLTTS